MLEGTNGYGVLFNFFYVEGYGSSDPSALVEGRDGALYGTTRFGGTNIFGTVLALGV